MLLCNDGAFTLDEDGRPLTLGDPTETALLVAASAAAMPADTVRNALPRLAELPFDSDRKRMTTVHRVEDASAAPDLAALVPAGGYLSSPRGPSTGSWGSRRRSSSTGVRPLDAAHRAEIEGVNAQLAGNGMRVLAVAYRLLEDPAGVADAEQDLVMLGLFGIIDPPRAEVRDAVATCRAAGIRPVMITGDHPLTASFIARDLGIADDERVVTGAELDRLVGDELTRSPSRPRSSPVCRRSTSSASSRRCAARATSSP